MSRRRSVKTALGSRHAVGPAASSRNSELVEFQQLIGDIRVRLSRLSRNYGEPMNFRFQQGRAYPRPHRSPARVEAEALYRLVQTGKDSLDSVRSLITVPPQLEAHVRDLSFPGPDDRRKLLASLKFRKQVLVEFENLVASDLAPAVAEGVSSANP